MTDSHPLADSLRAQGMLPDGVSPAMDDTLCAMAFRRLLAHLDARTDVQNIAIMELAGFCRNCLANWYLEAAQKSHVSVTRDDARRRIYGQDYASWKAQFQR